MADDQLQFWDASLLISSFENVPDAFYWVGLSTMDEIRDRMRLLSQGGRVTTPSPVDPTQLQIAYPPVLPAPSAPLAPPASPTRNEDNALKSQPPSPEMPKMVFPIGTRSLLVFDTETVGLTPPIICQLAYLVVEDGVVTTKYNQLLRLPVGARISTQAQQVHGISNVDCARRGVVAYEALELFARTCARIIAAGGRIVAHNSKFDVRAIRSTRLAHNVIDAAENQPLEVNDTFCTMTNSKQYSPLKDKAGRRKAFKLSELYEYLYGCPPTFARLHDAMGDVLVATLNYAEGARRGWW